MHDNRRLCQVEAMPSRSRSEAEGRAGPLPPGPSSRSGRTAYRRREAGRKATFAHWDSNADRQQVPASRRRSWAAIASGLHPRALVAVATSEANPPPPARAAKIDQRNRLALRANLRKPERRHAAQVTERPGTCPPRPPAPRRPLPASVPSRPLGRVVPAIATWSALGSHNAPPGAACGARSSQSSDAGSRVRAGRSWREGATRGSTVLLALIESMR